jgi:hypothetical protein
VDKTVFYDASRIAIIPMGYCYPERGKSGDLPPRRECATLWLDQLLDRLTQIELNTADRSACPTPLSRQPLQADAGRDSSRVARILAALPAVAPPIPAQWAVAPAPPLV